MLPLSPSLVTSHRSPPFLLSPTPSSLYSLSSSSAAVDAGHMPRCHSPFLFPQSAPQLCDSHQSGADAMATGPLGKRSSGPPGLYEPCRLTEQRSPPPHLDKGEGPRTSTVHTHTHTHTCLTTNIHKWTQGEPTSERRATTRCRVEPAAQKLSKLFTTAAHSPEWRFTVSSFA